MEFIDLLKDFWRGIPSPERIARREREKHIVAPPITHKVETKWTPISHNEPLRKTCGFVPPTSGYAPCTRPPHSSGPCAHPFATSHEDAEIVSHFTEIDALAQQLHREYRATSKALKGTAKHDHGWKHCRKKRYFWKRARQWRRDNAAVTKA